MTGTSYFTPEALTDYARAMFLSVGMTEADAGLIAGDLVKANLRGVDSHGVSRIPMYLDRLRRGLVNPRPDVKVARVAGAVAQVDGDDGMGFGPYRIKCTMWREGEKVIFDFEGTDGVVVAQTPMGDIAVVANPIQKLTAAGVTGQAAARPELAVLLAIASRALLRFNTGFLKVSRERLVESLGATGERVWRLPMHEEYREMMKSPVADIVNSNPNRKAHAGQGAAFLSYFVKEGVPWCHLDIAGVHVAEKNAGMFIDGPTGWGVRLLAELVG